MKYYKYTINQTPDVADIYYYMLDSEYNFKKSIEIKHGQRILAYDEYFPVDEFGFLPDQKMEPDKAKESGKLEEISSSIFNLIWDQFKTIKGNRIKGDLIDLALNGYFDVIIHGCNCFCTMGAGIAKSIKNTFPTAYEADKQTIKGDKDKLGNYTFSSIVINNKELTIINAYTQYGYSKEKPQVDYKSIRSVFKSIKKNFEGKKFAYNAIGAGLAGGDWNIIYKIICEEFKKENHYYVEYKK